MTETVTRLYKDYKIPEEIIGNRSLLERYTGANSKKELFYKIRDCQKTLNTDKWILSNPIYMGVPEMLEELKRDDVNTVILSSKDGDSIRLILNYHKLDRFTNSTVIDKDSGHRPEQFREFQGRFPGFNFAYDDLLVNLEDARKAGIRPILAPQGYESEDMIALSGYKGVVIAEPIEVAEAVRTMKEVL